MRRVERKRECLRPAFECQHNHFPMRHAPLPLKKNPSGPCRNTVGKVPHALPQADRKAQCLVLNAPTDFVCHSFLLDTAGMFTNREHAP